MITRLCFVVILTLVHCDGAFCKRRISIRPPSKIGHIDYYGYADLPIDVVKKRFPLHTGDIFDHKRLKRERPQIQRLISQVTGKPMTDMAVLCCDKTGQISLYIGLSGSSFHPLPVAATPHGSQRLEKRAIQLYDQSIIDLTLSAASGIWSEDDSSGYALSSFSSLRKTQLKMRSYAVDHSSSLIRVLRRSGDPRQRRAAAALLGYATRSNAQVNALSNSVSDVDDVVRNNAVRALRVLAVANTGLRDIPAEPFVRLLSSGTWSDRNKGSAILSCLIVRDDPNLSLTLQRVALQPLIEGALWSNPEHAYPFLAILGHIAGLTSIQVDEMIALHEQDRLISLAKSARIAIH